MQLSLDQLTLTRCKNYLLMTLLFFHLQGKVISNPMNCYEMLTLTCADATFNAITANASQAIVDWVQSNGGGVIVTADFARAITDPTLMSILQVGKKNVFVFFQLHSNSF